MRLRRLLLVARIVVAALLLVVAAVLALVARDALAAERTMRRDDLRFRVTPAELNLWRVEGRTPSLRRLLALDDDLAHREAARLFFLSRRRPDLTYDPGRAASRAEAQGAIARAEALEQPRAASSKLANLSAILSFEEALGDARNGRVLMRRSLAGFRRAIRDDGTNDDAKYNLELLLTLLGPDQQQRRDRLGIGTGSEQSSGAAAARAGRGY